MRDFITAAGGIARFVFGGLACLVLMAFCLALPAFIALAVTP